MKNQSSNHLFMIEPEVFYSNEQTADSNHYQKDHDTKFTKIDTINLNTNIKIKELDKNISSYVMSFNKKDEKKNLFINQLKNDTKNISNNPGVSQFLDTNNKNINNKGFTIMRELVDLIILAGGVLLRFNKNGRAEII